jgi:hypothetical protein
VPPPHEPVVHTFCTSNRGVIMKKKWWFVAVCSAVVALLGSSFASAQQSQQDTDQGLSEFQEARALSEADLRRLKPVVNALKPPNTSRLTADTMDDGYARGVMREDGPDYFADDSEAGYSARAFGSIRHSLHDHTRSGRQWSGKPVRPAQAGSARPIRTGLSASSRSLRGTARQASFAGASSSQRRIASSDLVPAAAFVHQFPV